MRELQTEAVFVNKSHISTVLTFLAARRFSRVTSGALGLYSASFCNNKDRLRYISASKLRPWAKWSCWFAHSVCRPIHRTRVRAGLLSFYVPPKMQLLAFFFFLGGGPKTEFFGMSWNFKKCKKAWVPGIFCWPFGPKVVMGDVGPPKMQYSSTSERAVTIFYVPPRSNMATWHCSQKLQASRGGNWFSLCWEERTSVSDWLTRRTVKEAPGIEGPDRVSKCWARTRRTSSERDPLPEKLKGSMVKLVRQPEKTPVQTHLYRGRLPLTVKAVEEESPLDRHVAWDANKFLEMDSKGIQHHGQNNKSWLWSLTITLHQSVQQTQMWKLLEERTAHWTVQKTTSNWSKKRNHRRPTASSVIAEEPKTKASAEACIAELRMPAHQTLTTSLEAKGRTMIHRWGGSSVFGEKRSSEWVGHWLF